MPTNNNKMSEKLRERQSKINADAAKQIINTLIGFGGGCLAQHYYLLKCIIWLEEFRMKVNKVFTKF